MWASGYGQARPPRRVPRWTIAAVVVVAGFVALWFVPLGPTSGALIVLFILASAALMFALVRLRRWPVRAVCGALALVLAMVAGVIEVNRYYGYYQSWSAMYTDLAGSPPDFGAAARRLHGSDPGSVSSGSVLTVSLPGARSHISRDGLVYLPPQYFEPPFAHVRFPVVELLPGSPGKPADWVNALRIAHVADLLSSPVT